MKALGWMAACALLGAGCVTMRGTGGSGIDVDKAKAACLRAAEARGWNDLRSLEEVQITSRDTARLRFDRPGFLKPDAICHFNDRTNAASVD